MTDREAFPAQELTQEEQERLGFEASRVFRPAAPINQRALFAGRVDQLRAIIDAVNQPGQHTIIFGERGVGKTSLANVLNDILSTAGDTVIAPRVNCDTADNFSSIWRKVCGEILIAQTTRRAGLIESTEKTWGDLTQMLAENVTPYDARRVLAMIATDSNRVIIIVDEFDRVVDDETATLMADTIKTLSDQDVSATLVIVGVADNVDDLVKEHLSIERALVQIRMPRMSQDELRDIVELGLARLEMDIAPQALGLITSLSHGLPHYTHLLGLYSTREAVDDGVRTIQTGHVEKSIHRAIENAQQSILSVYHEATTSTRRETLFPRVILACALAPVDALGYFTAADVREPIRAVAGRDYEIPAFARHLSELCEFRRGSILQKTGEPWRQHFRFRNPLMQPFIVMRGLADGLINIATLERFAQRVH